MKNDIDHITINYIKNIFEVHYKNGTVEEISNISNKDLEGILTDILENELHTK